MTDLLDAALSSLHRTDITPPPVSVVTHGAQRRVRRRRAVLASSAAIVVALAIGLLASASSQPPHERLNTNPGTTTTVVVTTTAPLSPTPPPGYQAVSTTDGRIAGYLSEAALAKALQDGEPTLPLGTGAHPLKGFPVVDAKGTTVGYFLSGDAGFVTLAQVADPKDADALGARQESEGMSQEEGRKLMEKLLKESD